MNKAKKVLFYRPSWIEIDLSAITHNFLQVKKIIKPDVKVMVLVKADAYGHGAVEVSRQLIKNKVDYLGVAGIDEAIVLRKAKINTPILVLSPIFPEHLETALKFNLTITLCSLDSAVALDKLAKKFKKKIKAHIKIDTGMGRLGAWHQEAEEEVLAISKLKNITLEGLYTHLSSADVDSEFTLQQLENFDNLITDLNRLGIYFKFYHAANSIGLIDFEQSHFNLARPGLVIYGLYPKSNLSRELHLQPAMSLHSKVIFAKDVAEGRKISYGATYVTSSKSRIVTIPVGYGDGFSRILSNRAPVIINNKLFKISGRICMDQSMVDVGMNKVKVGDEVVLLGRQGKNIITAEDLANLANTISYEIVCSLGQERLPRIYKK